MAMNKKEQAEMERLREELRIAKALRFTEKVDPDIEPPEWGGLKKGFLFNSYFDVCRHARVEKACASSVSHCMGDDSRTTSQGSRRLFSTELLAWRACRNAVEKVCAEQLAYIDAMIEKELVTREESRDGTE